MYNHLVVNIRVVGTTNFIRSLDLFFKVLTKCILLYVNLFLFNSDECFAFDILFYSLQTIFIVENDGISTIADSPDAKCFPTMPL